MGKDARIPFPDSIRGSYTVLLLAHCVIHALMLVAATAAKLDFDRLSFRVEFQILTARLSEGDPSAKLNFHEWYTMLLGEIGFEQIPPRHTGSPRA
jgi:hypothetical protein